MISPPFFKKTSYSIKSLAPAETFEVTVRIHLLANVSDMLNTS